MRALVTVVLSTALLLAACGADYGPSSDAEAAAPSSTTDSTAGTATPVAAADVPADPSPGCVATPVVPAGETERTLISGPIEHAYFQRVPPAHDGETPVPLVLDFHGFLESSSVHAAHSQLGPYGDEAGFVTLTPDSGRDPDRWELMADDDVEFVTALLDRTEAELCIDRNRVFSTGLSMGGFFSTLLSCRLSERIAAAAPVAGIAIPDPCPATRPVPAVVFFGTEDPIVAYEGGLGAGAAELPGLEGEGSLDDVDQEALEEALPGVEDSVAAWAGRNGCGEEVTEDPVADDVTLLAWDCPAEGTVELYRVEGGGHSWPGSDFSVGIADVVGATTTSIDANEVMWAFFQAHPRRP